MARKQSKNIPIWCKAKSPSIAGCITSKDYLDVFVRPKNNGIAHTAFFHYTKTNNANAILQSEQLRLTRLGITSNDTREKAWYTKNGKYLFSICFATGTSESLPLWYLYSGIDGKGVRFGFSRSQMCELLIKPELRLVKVQNDPPYSELHEIARLQDDDYHLQIKDIVYIGKDTQHAESFRIKHNGRNNNNVSKTVEYDLMKQYGAFCKNLIWFYEKETRVQIEIINPEYKKLLDSGENFVVTLSLKQLRHSFSVVLGPAFQKEDKESLLKQDGFLKFALSKIDCSEHQGQINMQLQNKKCIDCVFRG